MTMRRSKSLVLALAGVAASIAGGCKSDSTHATVIPPDAKIEDVKSKTPGPNMHVVAGDLALNQGNQDEANRQYQLALKADPKNAPALFKLAKVAVYRGDFDGAIGFWTRYIDVTHQSAEGYSNLGRTHELAGHWREAEVSYLKALEKDPKNKSAIVNYGILLAKRDRIDEAEERLSMVLAPAEVQYNLGSVFELRKNYDAARVAYGKAIDLDPKLTVAQQRLDMLKGVSNAN